MTRQGQQPFNNLGASSPTSCLGGIEIGDAPSYIKGAGENKMKTIMSKHTPGPDECANCGGDWDDHHQHTGQCATATVQYFRAAIAKAEAEAK